MGEKKTILLVEDEAIVSFSTSEELKQHDFNVLVAQDGKEAIEKVRSIADIDLILMDINLGGDLDGVEAAQIILLEREIPIVFLSNITEQDVLTKTEKIASYGYVVKTSGKTVLLASINMALRMYADHRLLKEQEANLEQSLETQRNEKRFRALVEHSADAITLLGPTGNVIYEGPTVKDLTGFSSEERIGQNALNNVHPEDISLVRETLSKVISDPGKMYTAIFRSIRKGGEIWWTEANATNLLNEPSVQAIVINYRDITMRRQYEDALAEAVKEKSILLSDLQHRIKNSLTLITSLISLESNSLEGEEARRAMEDIRGRVNSLAQLYTYLYESGNINEVRLDDYLTRIARSLADSYIEKKKNIHLVMEFSEIIISSRNATSFGLILNELLTNALKYAFQNGRCGTIRISLQRQKGQIILEVSDDGIGLPADFDLSTHTGLGLQIVKMLVKQLQGTVELDKNGKTTFIVRASL